MLDDVCYGYAAGGVSLVMSGSGNVHGSRVLSDAEFVDATALLGTAIVLDSESEDTEIATEAKRGKVIDHE